VIATNTRTGHWCTIESRITDEHAITHHVTARTAAVDIVIACGGRDWVNAYGVKCECVEADCCDFTGTW
jgi:hypothetical protein